LKGKAEIHTCKGNKKETYPDLPAQKRNARGRGRPTVAVNVKDKSVFTQDKRENQKGGGALPKRCGCGKRGKLLRK